MWLPLWLFHHRCTGFHPRHYGGQPFKAKPSSAVRPTNKATLGLPPSQHPKLPSFLPVSHRRCLERSRFRQPGLYIFIVPPCVLPFASQGIYVQGRVLCLRQLPYHQPWRMAPLLYISSTWRRPQGSFLCRGGECVKKTRSEASLGIVATPKPPFSATASWKRATATSLTPKYPDSCDAPRCTSGRRLDPRAVPPGARAASSPLVDHRCTAQPHGAVHLL